MCCGSKKALSFLPCLKVSHDFAVNFDEDNPECAGELPTPFPSPKHGHRDIHTLLRLLRLAQTFACTTKAVPACLSYLPCCRSHIPPFIFVPDFFLPCFCSSQICTDIRTRSNTHGRTRSWEVCHYAAGSISGSRTQRKTTLICMCEMGFCAPLFTWLTFPP